MNVRTLLKWSVIFLLVALAISSAVKIGGVFSIFAGGYFLVGWLVGYTGLSQWLAWPIAVLMGMLILYALRLATTGKLWRYGPALAQAEQRRLWGYSLLVGIFSVWCLAIYAFEAPFNPLSGAAGCYSRDLYGNLTQVSCDWKTDRMGNPIQRITLEVARQMQITQTGLPQESEVRPSKSIRYFDYAGNPLVYYYEFPSGRIALSLTGGTHRLGMQLNPITPEIAYRVDSHPDLIDLEDTTTTTTVVTSPDATKPVQVSNKARPTAEGKQLFDALQELKLQAEKNKVQVNK